MSKPSNRDTARARLAASDLKVGDLMSQPVKTLRPEETLSDAAILMERHRFRHCPIVDKSGKFVGLLSERDLIREVASGNCATKLATRLADVMRKESCCEITSISPSQSARTAAIRMREEKIGCLPVIDDASGALIGIITESDFVGFFADGL